MRSALFQRRAFRLLRVPAGDPIAPVLPSITSVSPSSGPSGGGTLVTLIGTGFGFCSGVTFGGVAASISSVASQKVTCLTPVAGGGGPVDVVLTTPNGSATKVGAFTYAATAPTVSSVSPASGPAAGGTAVTVTGTNFTGATAVRFNGVNATSVVVVNSTTITCVTPAGSGSIAVAVTTPSGTGSLGSAFTYIAAPTVSAITPNLADTAGGGGIVTITGTNFTGASGVTLGGTAATSVTVVNSTTITCIPGARAAASGLSVVVTTPGGSNGANTLFEYWSPSQITGVDFYLDANKAVTGGAAVSAWVDQSSNAVSFSQGTAPNRPAQTASVFGTLPSIRFTPEQWVACSGRTYATSISIFAVAKWTATKATLNGGYGCVPLSIVGDTANGNTAFGASAGAINYTNSGTTAQISRGSGNNSGTPKLIGVTQSSAPETKHYLGTVQQGATETTTAFSAGTRLDVVGESSQLVDGWNGDLGAVVVVNGIISGSDLTKLNSWAKQRWGTP